MVPGDEAVALNEQGVALARQGRFDEAAVCFRRAIAVWPAYASAYNNLGLVLARQGRLDEAVSSYHQALCFEPGSAEALVNLGNAFREQGKPEAAVAALRRATQLRPALPEAHVGLGQVLARQNRLVEAEEAYRQGLRSCPEAPALWLGLGNVLGKLWRLEEAEAALREALRRSPDSADAHNALGVIEAQRGRDHDALACFERALELRPDLPDGHANRAMIWLLHGDYQRGWAEYEWRFRGSSYAARPMPRPAWDGSDLAGRTILIHSEMGFGDALQFARYAALVKRKGARVLLECPPPLVQLLSTCPGVDRAVPRGSALPPFDVHAPLMSLPSLLGTTLQTVPAEVPYLSAEPERVERWGRELRAAPGLRVGIAWQGSLSSPSSRVRAVPLAAFAPLAAIEGVTLYSLQKGPGSEQLQEVAGRMQIIDLGPRLDVGAAAFVDTAAVMKNLDLVISSDTAIIHLAGALGVPVWVALGYPAEWRWLLGRDDSPWYPTLRLFRQEAPGDWASVFRRIAAELRRLAPGPGRLVRAPLPPSELLDRAVVLELQTKKASGPQEAALRAELAALTPACDPLLADQTIAALVDRLRAVVEALAEATEGVRACEREQDFGPRFVALARAVGRYNDEREALKRRIDAQVNGATP